MKQRVISAVVAIAIVLPLIIIGGIPLTVGVALVAAIALWEILRLKDKKVAYPLIVKIIAFICLEIFVLIKREGSFIHTGISYLPIAISALALLIPSVFYKKEQYSTKDAFNLLGAVLLIGLFFNSLIVMYNTPILVETTTIKGIWLLLYLFLVAACTDTFAMIIGCLIGKHKLIPEVSPKKSVEGSIAGSLMGTVIGTLYYVNIIGLGNMPLWVVILMTLILTVFGQVGDLFFSKIKREHDIKDFSNIMPGHGGILDRLDSFSFVLLGYIIIISIISLF